MTARKLWYESKPGETSSGRIESMIGVVVGAIGFLGGIVLVASGKPESVAICAIGAGLMGGSHYLKTKQSASEKDQS
jgi:hypothetical protein